MDEEMARRAKMGLCLDCGEEIDPDGDGNTNCSYCCDEDGNAYCFCDECEGSLFIESDMTTTANDDRVCLDCYARLEAK